MSYSTEALHQYPSQLTATRDIQFAIQNETDTLLKVSEPHVFAAAENQVMHYLLEHVIPIQNPYLFTHEAEQTPYSYKLLETTNKQGEKRLKPADYDDKTTFAQLCAGPLNTHLMNLNIKKSSKSQIPAI